MIDILQTLDSRVVEITKECLRAAADGPFFPDWEFQTLIGVDRKTVRRVHGAWPDQTVDDEDFSCAVVGSLNNLLGYPHGQESQWSKYISVEPEQIRLVLKELIAAGL